MVDPFVFGGTGESPGKPRKEEEDERRVPQEVDTKWIVSSISSGTKF